MQKTEAKADRSYHEQVAKTIINQMGGHKLLGLMIGVKSYTFDHNNVAFRYMKADRNKSNYVDIKLTSDDTYTLNFWWIHGDSCKEVQTIEGVYCDQLIPVFSDATGLSLVVPKLSKMSC